MPIISFDGELEMSRFIKLELMNSEGEKLTFKQNLRFISTQYGCKIYSVG